MKFRIGVISAKDGSFEPLIYSQFHESGPWFSPDGKWIVYVSHQSGRMEVFVQSIAGGRRYQVSTDGGWSPRWNGDGIYYHGPGNKLFFSTVSYASGFSAGIPEPLFDMGTTESNSPYDVLDRNRFLANTSSERNEIVPIMLIQNWSMLNKD